MRRIAKILALPLMFCIGTSFAFSQTESFAGQQSNTSIAGMQLAQHGHHHGGGWRHHGGGWRMHGGGGWRHGGWRHHGGGGWRHHARWRHHGGNCRTVVRYRKFCSRCFWRHGHYRCHHHFRCFYKPRYFTRCWR